MLNERPIPEAALRARHFLVLRRVLRTDPANPNAFTEEDIERYVEAWSRCGDFSGPVNYYRALRYLKLRGLKERLRPIDIPTLVIWGDQDRYLGRALAEPPRAHVPRARVERLPRASHWVHLDEPERVNALLLSFLHGE